MLMNKMFVGVSSVIVFWFCYAFITAIFDMIIRYNNREYNDGLLICLTKLIAGVFAGIIGVLLSVFALNRIFTPYPERVAAVAF